MPQQGSYGQSEESHRPKQQFKAQTFWS